MKTTRSSDTNIEGLTLLEWLYAAGRAGSEETVAAWRVGEDPTEWRAESCALRAAQAGDPGKAQALYDAADHTCVSTLTRDGAFCAVCGDTLE